jgi:hypothetical protein
VDPGNPGIFGSLASLKRPVVAAEKNRDDPATVVSRGLVEASIRRPSVTMYRSVTGVFGLRPR